MFKKSTLFLILMLLAIYPFTTGCAKFWDNVESKGGIITSSKAPYIIVNASGGFIMDVYKLTSAIVQSPQSSDGWLFLDNNGRPIYLGGDVKTIRFQNTNDPLWNKFHEYHHEVETLTYREKFFPDVTGDSPAIGGSTSKHDPKLAEDATLLW